MWRAGIAIVLLLSSCTTTATQPQSSANTANAPAPIDATTAANPAPARFVFGGSRFQTDRKSGRERYLADGSGSLIGLVTFGDETIGAAEVVPDQAGVATPTWEVFSERMPTPGTRVTIMVNRIP